MNEELQTSKEELQSLNEELETVNSELKNKVQELDSANSDLQNLYESTRIATLFLDNELCVKAFTPAATELFRIIDSDIGRSINDVVHRFNSVDLIAEARKVLKNLGKRNREISHRETGNHYFMQMMPYRTINNVIDGVTVSFVDVTQLKKAKTDLEIRERMLRLVTDSVPGLIAYVDNRVRYKYCNATYGDWFSLNKKDLHGKKVREVLGEESYAEIAPFVDRALAGEIVEYTTTLNLLHDGEKIVSVRYEPHLSDDGKVCGFISFVQDESERIQKERKLARLAAIAGSSHEVIIGKTTEGIITDWNTGAEELYGYSEEEAVGQHIHLIVPEQKQEELELAIARISKGEVIAPFETKRVAKDGSIKNIHYSLSPFRSEKGEILGISSVGHDISSRIKAEQQLEALNENLERRVGERTEQLHNLTARFLNLEQRERRRFSKYLHDDIQQSLVAAKMLVEQAHREPEGQKVTPTLSEGLRLLNESIQKTRLVTMDMSPPLFFDTGISICLQWLSRWADAKLNQKIETSIKGEEKPIAEEIGYLIFRSLRELLFNIQKHAAVEKAEITVAYGDDGSLNVVISDAGKGFDTERVMESSSEKFGLLSVIEQVRAMKGKAKLESEPGKGTRISIALPDAVVDSSTSSNDVLVENLAGLNGDNRKRLQENEGKTLVLIVDDQEDLRFTLRLMLEEISSDYIYLEADTAKAAIEAVKEFKPQLVLMDISMPGMSGVEATRTIKEESGKTAVIGLSMHDREDMEKAMVEAGAEGYLTKDSSSEVILAAIEECLEKQRQQADQRR